VVYATVECARSLSIGLVELTIGYKFSVYVCMYVCMYVCNKTIYIAAYATSRFEAALQS